MITLVIFWLIGLLSASFTLVPVGICLFFALPTTRRMTREGVLVKSNPLIKRYSISVLILSAIFVIVSVLVYFFGPDQAINGYIGGIVVALLFGVGKMGATKTNTAEYLENNQRYLAHNNPLNS